MPATHGEKWWKMHFLLVVFHVFGDAITPTPNGTTTWDVAAETAETRQVVDPRGWPPVTDWLRVVVCSPSKSENYPAACQNKIFYRCWGTWKYGGAGAWHDATIGQANKVIEGSLEVKLPTIWTVEKQRWEESEETRSEERRCRCAKR